MEIQRDKYVMKLKKAFLETDFFSPALYFLAALLSVYSGDGTVRTVQTSPDALLPLLLSLFRVKDLTNVMSPLELV